MDLETTRLNVSDGVATLTLNRPGKLNAISTTLAADLGVSLQEAVNAAARVIVVHGEGKAFCAGADIEEASAVSSVASSMAFLDSVRRSFVALRDCPVPTIAAVHGAAMGGGCEVALACDIRIADATARFGLPEVKIGALPAGGGMARLPSLIGTARTKELVFTGTPIDGETAERYGLVNQVTGPGDHLREALEMAAAIAKNSGITLRLAKRAIDAGADADPRVADEVELFATVAAFGTADRAEGMAAFLDKRAPRFEEG